jgi:hypothetical protein
MSWGLNISYKSNVLKVESGPEAFKKETALVYRAAGKYADAMALVFCEGIE